MIEQISETIKIGFVNPGVGHKYSGLDENKQIFTINVLSLLSNPFLDKDVYYEIETVDSGVISKTKIKKEDLAKIITRMNLIKI